MLCVERECRDFALCDWRVQIKFSGSKRNYQQLGKFVKCNRCYNGDQNGKEEGRGAEMESMKIEEEESLGTMKSICCLVDMVAAGRRLERYGARGISFGNLSHF